MSLNESGINSRAGAKAKVENNYFKDSKDVLGTFYTDEAGYWQVAGNIFDNVTWSSPGSDNNPAGPNPTSNTTVSIPYSYSLDAARCVPAIVAPDGRRQQGPEGVERQLHAADADADPDHADPDADPAHARPDQPHPTPTPPTGTNLSIGAGADGSSKASGTSYGNVHRRQPEHLLVAGRLDRHDLGQVGLARPRCRRSTSVRRPAPPAASGPGSVLNNDNGAVLATGSGAGVISFTATSLSKINFEITSSSATPRVAEFETYAK